MTKETTLKRLESCGVVAVIRAPSETILPDIAKALIEGGIIGIEVTMSTPNAIKGIEKLSNSLGDTAVVGVGTILDAQTCEAAIHAGAEFVVSPVFNPAIIETTKRLGKVSIPGAYTPTEILAAWKAGADVVKVYPATRLGPEYFKDLLAPMPFLRLTPTGGVDVNSTSDWIKAGAVMVGAGSSLLSKDAMAKGNWAAITATARHFVEAVKRARAS